MRHAPHPSGTRAGRKLVQLCKHHYPWICHLCGQPIPRTATEPHPQSFEADHLVTDPRLRMMISNLRPSHKWCNQIRGNRPLTTGLIAEIKIRYATKFLQQPRPALAFFDVDDQQGGGHPSDG